MCHSLVIVLFKNEDKLEMDISNPIYWSATSVWAMLPLIGTLIVHIAFSAAVGYWFVQHSTKFCLKKVGQWYRQWVQDFLPLASITGAMPAYF